MLIGIGGYSPLSVRKRSKMLAKERRKAKRSPSSAGVQPVDEGASVRPEGKRGLIWDVLKFHHQLQLAAVSLKEEYARLIAFGEQALDLKQSDKERRLLNQKYLNALETMDAFVGGLKVEGESLFEKETIKVFSVANEGAGEEIKYDIPSFTTTDLQIKETKLDSLISARRTEKLLETVQKKIDKFLETLKTKAVFLQVKRKSIGMEMPDFDAILKSKERADEQVAEQLNQMSQDESFEEEDDEERLLNPAYLPLRVEQEMIAKNKGRQQGLLIRTAV